MSLFKDPYAQDGGVRLEQAAYLLEEFLFGSGSRAEDLREIAVEALAARALARSQAVDAGSLERSEGLAAIYPAMMNSIFALMALGHGTGRSADLARD